MDKIFVADSYKDCEIVSEPFANDAGRMYVKIKGKCPRCGGSGHYSYNEKDGTMCYGCGGSGWVTQTVRAYTEKEYTSMQKAKTRAAEKRIAAREAKQQDLIQNAAKYKHEVALKLGFNDEEKAYLVCGENTFNIKDDLKAVGGRFSPVLKWYLPTPAALPDDYFLCEITFDEVYTYNPMTKFADFKEDVEDVIKAKITEQMGPSDTEFYPAEVGTRLYDIEVVVENIKGFDGLYGYTTIYTFAADNYRFVWMTAKSNLDLAIDDVIILTGTIKKFDIYNNVHQTFVTRCSVQKI